MEHSPGTYELKIGASSQDIRLKQQIVLTGDKVVKPLRDHYFSRLSDKRVIFLPK